MDGWIDRQIATLGQINRQIDKKGGNGWMDGQMDRQLHWDRYIDRQIKRGNGWMDRQIATLGQICRQIDKKGKWMDRQIQMYNVLYIVTYSKK